MIITDSYILRELLQVDLFINRGNYRFYVSKNFIEILTYLVNRIGRNLSHGFYLFRCKLLLVNPDL